MLHRCSMGVESRSYDEVLDSSVACKFLSFPAFGLFSASARTASANFRIK